jgi:hypothetical protein
MKKILLIVITSFFYLSAHAQSVNDVPLKDIDVEYVQIVGTSKLLSNKVMIEIDFGQHNKIFQTKDTVLKDKDGRPMVLNSMVDALNFMVENGYEFVQAYAFAAGNQSVYHYLLKRK